MTKKDYILIAQVLNCYVWSGQGQEAEQKMLLALSDSLAEAFKQKNTRFNKQKFMDAVYKK